MSDLTPNEQAIFDAIAEDYEPGELDTEKATETAREVANSLEAILNGEDEGVAVTGENAIEWLRRLSEDDTAEASEKGGEDEGSH